MSWEAFVRETIGTEQQKTAAEKSGLDQSAISRWLKTGKPGTAESVAAFARGYKRPVLEAFIAAGFITEREANVRPAGRPDFSRLSNDELLELVRARMSEGGEHGGDTAATKDPGSGTDNVRPLTPPDDGLDDLAPESDEAPPIGGGRELPEAARRDRRARRDAGDE